MEREDLIPILKSKGYSFDEVEDFFKVMERDDYRIEYYADLKLVREIILWAVGKNGYTFKYVDSKFHDDLEVVMAVVKDQGVLLEFVSERLRNDRDVVIAAVTTNGLALRHASIYLRGQKDVVMAAVKCTAAALKYTLNNLHDDREIVLEAMSNHIIDYSIAYASERLRNDKEIVLTALLNARRHNVDSSNIFQYAGSELRDIVGNQDPIETLKSILAEEFLSNNIKASKGFKKGLKI